MLSKTKKLQDSKLKFLELPASSGYTELELENAIIENLQNFILELGKGFAFVTKQPHVVTETADFYIKLKTEKNNASR
jgi:predicted nuclease of restriction endonuclease-like (RecB) superfamily